jgi:serine protease Do
MFSFSKKQNIVLGIVALILTAGAGFGVFQYFQYTNNIVATSNEISSLKNQLASLASTNKSQSSSLTGIVAKAGPAVVSVVVSKNMPLLKVEYVNPFGDDPNYQNSGIMVPVFKQVGTKSQEIGAGTGFLVRSDGYIVTNKHVVSDPQASYTVLLSSGQKKTAKVIYQDSTHDIAVIKIDGTGYTTLPIGDSSNIELGQSIVAIGNALGEYNNSVSVGIISGLNRTIEAQDNNGNVETLSDIIQTDVAINRGNSGGPLLDLDGKVVGINVAIDQGGNNIAFAIPVNVINPILSKVLP